MVDVWWLLILLHDGWWLLIFVNIATLDTMVDGWWDLGYDGWWIMDNGCPMDNGYNGYDWWLIVF